MKIVIKDGIVLSLTLRIIDDRIEMSIKGRRVRHNVPKLRVCAREELPPPPPLTPILHPLAVVTAQRHPQTTHLPHAWPGVGNGSGRRVRQGSTGPAPLPLDSTPAHSVCWVRPVQIVTNLSSIHTLFYSVIYISVV